MYHRCTMSDVNQDGLSSRLPQADEARRRLLRGSLALPAVLTVSPGAAAALSLNCAQPAPVGGQEAVAPALQDQWYRVEVTAIKKKVDDGYLYFKQARGNSGKYNWYRISPSAGDPSAGDVAKLSSEPLLTDFYSEGTLEYQTSQVKYRVVQLYDAVNGTYGHPKAMGLENGWCTMACYYSLIH
jgi:hypothetical protein